MHIHILGICGTFMGGVALLARQLGFKVTGSDANVYPPMSTQLEAQGIELKQGFEAEHLDPAPDCVVVGNAMSRGNAAVESMLDKGIAYLSGPEFMQRHIFPERWVLAVAGTHGKTTTTSMLAWILEDAGFDPGFLIGGVPANFGVSARLGDTDKAFFVIEADEYDTAFFDKRSKFVHYHPRTLVINNLEYDHADIFPDMDAIKRQFHHLIRTVPGSGLIIAADEDNIASVLNMGCWTPVETVSVTTPQTWSTKLLKSDGSCFEVYCNNRLCGMVEWGLLGHHNVANALSAIAAARHVGVIPEQAIAALPRFKNVKRRMELRGVVQGISVYDDFAHHPTAIKTTLHGLRERIGDAKLFAVLEPRSNTMRMGIHKNTLIASLQVADEVLIYQPADPGWTIDTTAATQPCEVFDQVDNIVDILVQRAQSGQHILIMSNGGFDNIHNKLLCALEQNET